jgi:transposase-like protein
MGMHRFYSNDFKERLVEKYCSGNYTSIQHAADCFGIPSPTFNAWLRERGIKPKGYTPPMIDEEVEPEAKEHAVREEKKELSFVEPEPDPSSFRSDRERADYYMMRSYYLEELFRLCDLDEVSKKKALRQLEQRVRERLARGDKSPY